MCFYTFSLSLPKYFNIHLMQMISYYGWNLTLFQDLWGNTGKNTDSLSWLLQKWNQLLLPVQFLFQQNQVLHPTRFENYFLSKTRLVKESGYCFFFLNCIFTIVKILNIYIMLSCTHLYHSSFRYLSITCNAFIACYIRC